MLPQPGLKNELDGILARCNDEIGARKAALYLADDEAPAVFDLVSQIGYDEQRIPARVDASDGFVAQLLRKRAAFFVNGVKNELEYMELLGRANERQLHERLPSLLVPLYRGRIVGYFELREKHDHTVFTPSDLEKAKRIAAAVMDSFVARGLYGLTPPAAATPLNVVPLRAPHKEKRRREFSSTAKEAVEKAKAVVAREAITAHARPFALAEEQIAAIKSVLPAMLTLPGSSIASVISHGPAGPMHVMAARSSITAPALETFLSKVAVWIRKRREETAIPKPNTTLHPLGTNGPSIQPAHIATVLNAPVALRGVPGIVLSVAFETALEPRTHRQLEIFLHELERALEHAASARDLHQTRRTIAGKLLEPEFESYPDLRVHCHEVAALAERFARAIGLPADDRERLILGALVHDAGLRPLDYRHLAHEADLPEEDLQTIREHPVVGAAMVAPVLGWDVANIVLAHQERFDGTGYPYRLKGEAIPLTARMLHLCDAWVAMTLAKPYRQARSKEEALQEIERGAGTQFDPELAARFRTLIA